VGGETGCYDNIQAFGLSWVAAAVRSSLAIESASAGVRATAALTEVAANGRTIPVMIHGKPFDLRWDAWLCLGRMGPQIVSNLQRMFQRFVLKLTERATSACLSSKVAK
jgi:hypothetical protein